MNLDDLSTNICLLALDNDGVLTDGGVYIGADGSEFRRYDIKDGLGIRRVMAAGIPVAIISSAASASILHRAAQLGITEVHTAVEDKLATLAMICSRMQITLEQVAYMGDDLLDLPILNAVGLPCAPADAVHEVQEAARYVSSHRGGYGAVRDVCELLIDAETYS